MALALVLLFLPGAYREGLARGLRQTVLRPVLAIQTGAVERHARFDDPDRLRSQRDSLAAFLVSQTAMATENHELRQLLGLRHRMPPSFVPAEVVWVPGRGASGYFQLTAGANHEIGVGAPIVAPDGLVGRVVSVDPGIAFGIGWMNPQFRASAMTLDGSVYGLVEPREGPGGEPMLALTGTPRHVRLEDGTLIVTSGHGGVFPRGIPIGRIAGVEGKETSWQRNYLIEPAVAPSEMTYVLVLGGPQPIQQENGFDLAGAWGIRAAASPAADTAAAADLAASAPPGGTAATAGAPASEQPQATAAPAPRTTQPAPRAPELLGVPVRPRAPADTSGPR